MLLKFLAVLFLFTFPMHAYNIDQMTLDEKVGQLLMVHFKGEAANQEAEDLIQKTHVGGIIYYTWANGLTSREQIRTLSASLQSLAKKTRLALPLLISIDQEGGRVNRLPNGFLPVPSNRILGSTCAVESAEAFAFTVGDELMSVGINMNLAPVVDIDSNPRNPVIGERSFGSSPDLVAAFGQKALEGYKRAGILATLKHYPGHGDVETDSHEGVPVVNKTRTQLDEMEFYPFARLAPEADAVMTAHLKVPALDPDNIATTSKEILSILRNEMDFQGVIITDSLIMNGIVNTTGSADEAAVKALAAGCDILLLGGRLLTGTDAGRELTAADVARIHKHIVEAVKEGRVPEARVDEAVGRILELKKRIPTEN